MTTTHDQSDQRSFARASSAEELIAQLRTNLFHQRETIPDAHIYVLLDTNNPVALDHPLNLEQLAERPINRRIEPIARADFAHDPTLHPVVLQLYVAGESGYPDEELLELTAAQALAQYGSVSGVYVAAWIVSRASPQALGKQLASTGVVLDKAKAQRRFIAFFEPYRLALLQQDPQASEFLNHWMRDISQWNFVDASGHLQTITLRTSPDSRPTTPIATPHLELSHFRSQARVGLARHASAMLRKAQALPQSPESQIDHALQCAQIFGLKHTEDQLFFVLNSFTLSPSWNEHPVASRCITRSVEEGAPLTGLFTELDADTLAAIAAYKQ